MNLVAYLPAQSSRYEQQLLEAEAWSLASSRGFGLLVEWENGNVGSAAALQPVFELMASEGFAGLIVRRLSDLSGSVLGLAQIAEEHFSPRDDGTRELFALEEGLDTTTSSGRLFLVGLRMLVPLKRELEAECLRTLLPLLPGKHGCAIPQRSPYGYRLVALPDGQSRLEPIAEEQKVIRRIIDYRLAGWTYNRIATMFRSEGVPSKRGGQWGHVTVQRAFNREMMRRASG